ncbi:DUF2460 domain-containing protein [Acinetobacter johnsonii]|uniref:DUF2460 domain-containing protein n=1 Tax=Acinetobacter johnsonii TaxID=40214 RepID=A0A380TSV5_ACIJO|nr:DUF2460 domain-containing protein [Acinetobacter johnsonii]ENU40174.1 hypothetical protein F986_01087 [Acinetobacter johnsonii CIP 64.6]QPS02818.1 DUF2460 domain-containing protein [Acinetobacter johnsonii]SUT91422.1 Uncharacterized conserved protein [Acinetobacter johnsonii]
MSDVLFPDVCIGYDFVKKPMFNTKIMTSVNGRELRASYQAVPKYEISLSLPILRESKREIQKIEDFFIARRGAFDSFLFKMPWDNEYECTFNGDGTTTSFQLYKGQLPLGNTETFETEDPLMWDEDLDKPMWTDLEARMWDMQYGVSKNGVLTLPAPLAAGDKVTVKGTFYYRCRFADDGQAFTLFSYRLWKGEVTLIGSLGNKV